MFRTSRPMPARFHEQKVKSKLLHRRALSQFLDALVHEQLEGIKRISLTYIFVTDEALLEINQQFLNHDTYTDIVTFDLGETENELVGEIYVSIDRVAENAETFKTTYERELHRVIFHGTLHLCGYGDKTKEEQTEMRGMEDQCLNRYFNEQALPA